MTKDEHRRQLQDPRWQKKAAEIKIRDNWTCQDCGAGLEDGYPFAVHHLAYTTRLLWEEPDENLMTLCDPCHQERGGPKWVPRDQYARRLSLFLQKLHAANVAVSGLLQEAHELKTEASALKITAADIKAAGSPK